jgi:methyl-accepting chemotaxis protein/carbonic anhydrase
MKFFNKTMIIMAILTCFIAPQLSMAATKPLPDKAIQMLKDGNDRFVSGKSRHPNTTSARLIQAGTENQGDHAYATVITCSDSRVPVERIFDAGVMDNFVIRVAGNVCDTDEIGSIEYGLAHVNTPVLVVLGHTQCGAVTAVTHAVHGTGHALERNIPPLVDNITPAVKRAMFQNPGVHGDAIIPYAIIENVWQGVEDLFMNSPSTREIVESGKAKVVGAVYDVGTGKINWLPELRVSQILNSVKANPQRAMNAMAISDHGDTAGHGTGQAKGVEHVEVKSVPVTLTDSQTMEILRTDWLKEAQEEHLATKKAEFSGLFWGFLGVIAVIVTLGLVLFTGGTFNRFGITLKLYTSYGSLILLAAMLGAGGYMYLSRVTTEAHLETAFLELDIMANEIQVAQREFLLHGIENKEYGEKQVAVIKGIINEFSEDADILRGTGHLNADQEQGIEEMLTAVGSYTKEFGEVVKAYHGIEENKEKLDELGEQVNEALEEMIHHHEAELAQLEAQGSDMQEIRYQTLLVEHLDTAEILSLKVSRDEVEFMLDKNADRVGSMANNMGLLKGYLKVLEGELRSTEEKARLKTIEKEIETYIGLLKQVIRDEAIIEKTTSETTELMHRINATGTRLAHEAEIIADGMVREADIALIALIIMALAIGMFFSIFIARSISKPINRTIEGLNEGAEQVAAAAGQVSSSSQALAEGSSEQAASLEETSSSLEEMSSMTKQNADHATLADKLMKEANQVVRQANDSMTELTGSMEEISNASEETSKIIKTIDEIAFQTNLLALNAAVEAARAGEAGAGFAVVADEVRNLAMRAADAAKDTSELIEGTVKKVNDGGDLVNKTNDAFSQVAKSAEKVGELVGEIAAASNEQAQGIGQVNTAVTEMDSVTQGNAANSEESAAAAEEMTAQAEQMKSYVEDLVAIVGGNRKNGSNSFQTRVNVSDTIRPNALTTKKRAVLPKLHEVNPEQVIPMGDADLKNF